MIWGYHDQCVNNIVRVNSADQGADNWEVNSLSYPLFVNSNIGPTVPAPNQINCLADDPLFVNPNGGDFRIGSGSPCRDVGTNLTWMAGASDLNGQPRIMGGRCDIGAYEYVEASVPVLSAYRSGGGLVLSWPTNAPGFALWWAANLPATLWHSNSTSPKVINGQFTITDPASDTGRFYRLLK